MWRGGEGEVEFHLNKGYEPASGEGDMNDSLCIILDMIHRRVEHAATGIAGWDCPWTVEESA